MPYKSQAQRRLFHHLVKQGKIAPEAVEEYDRESKGKKMPEYVKRKAFGGEVEAKAGVHCPACDLPLDSVPVALDAGEGCPRCGYGDAKDVPHKAHGGEVMEPTTYRARGGEVERKSRGDSQYSAKSVDEFLTKLDSAMARIKRIDSDLPYNPAPWHERTDDERKPTRMTADPSVPKRRAFGLLDAAIRRRGPYLEEGHLGTMQEEYKNSPTPNQARRVMEAAKELAKGDPEFSEEWRKNTSGRMGDLKAADRYAHGGEIPLKGDLKELYPGKKAAFAKALRRRR